MQAGPRPVKIPQKTGFFPGRLVTLNRPNQAQPMEMRPGDSLSMKFPLSGSLVSFLLILSTLIFEIFLVCVCDCGMHFSFDHFESPFAEFWFLVGQVSMICCVGRRNSYSTDLCRCVSWFENSSEVHPYSLDRQTIGRMIALPKWGSLLILVLPMPNYEFHIISTRAKNWTVKEAGTSCEGRR